MPRCANTKSAALVARLLCLCLLAAAMFCLAPPATAADKTWTGGTGQWDVSDNWSPSGQPLANDDVYFTQSDATDRTVTYYNTTNPDDFLHSLWIDSTGAGVMTLDMPNTHLLKASNVYVGQSGEGAIIIRGGTLSSLGYLSYLGYNSGSTGTVTVTGTGSMWASPSNLAVGSSGSGVLNIEAGGQVTSTTSYIGQHFRSTGTAKVTGAGSKWTISGNLNVGNNGNGTLNIEAGGLVSNANGYIGESYASTGAATVTGTGSTWINSGRLYVGYESSGTLTVADGGLVSAGTLYASLGNLLGNGTIMATQGAVLDANIVLGGTTGTTPTLSFGSGGILNLSVTSAGTLGAGYKGTGTLRIADGVTVTSAEGCLGRFSGSTGTATVAGTGSTWTNSGGLYVGFGGSGTLNIEAGGQVSNDEGYLGGGNVGLTSTATVTGAGSTWTNGLLCIGYDRCSGTLNIQAGGHVSSVTGNIGRNTDSPGTVTVTGAGSKWANSGNLRVGVYGNGTLNIQAGGQVSNTNSYVGYYSGSIGTATVDGNGSLWNNTESLDVGSDGVTVGGTGSVTVQNGGKLILGGTLKLWKADSTVTVSGGTLTAATITNNGVLTVQSGGSVTVTGALANAGSLTVNDAMLSATTITNTGTIRGRGDINGVITNNAGGVVAPGASPGILTVDAITFADGSTLQIELGGLVRGTEYDVLAASGAITFQGECTLTLSLINGFVPQWHDEFDILDFAGASGHFNVLNLPQLGGGLSWDTSDLYAGGTIVVAPEPATVAMVAMGVAAMGLRRRRR